MAGEDSEEVQGAEAAQAFLQSIVDTVREPLLVLDTGLRVVTASRSFYTAFEVTPGETEGERIYELGSGQWDIPELRRLLENILPGATKFEGFEVAHDFPGIGPRTMLLNARKLYRPGNNAEMLLLAIEDVTERRRAEEERERTSRALRVAYERERHIAEALQRPLTLEVAEDAFPGLLVATLYEAASAEADVGGDFFDAFALPRGLVALAVADASGKGLPAAARTLQVKDVLRAFAREYPFAPNHIASRLNDYVCDTRRFDEQGGEGFVCFCLAVLNPETGEGNIVSAGCEPPAVLRRNGAVEGSPVHGLPLGIEREMLYQVSALHLGPGDTLLLSTDGITEARRGNEFLGYEGMIALARRHLGAPPLRAAGKAILEGAKAFSGGTLRDDACLLLARKL